MEIDGPEFIASNAGAHAGETMPVNRKALEGLMIQLNNVLSTASWCDESLNVIILIQMVQLNESVGIPTSYIKRPLEAAVPRQWRQPEGRRLLGPGRVLLRKGSDDHGSSFIKSKRPAPLSTRPQRIRVAPGRIFQGSLGSLGYWDIPSQFRRCLFRGIQFQGCA